MFPVKLCIASNLHNDCLLQKFDLQEYLTKGVERIVGEAVRATLKNPRESAFMLKFASASKKASAKRAEAGKNGEHYPRTDG